MKVPPLQARRTDLKNLEVEGPHPGITEKELTRREPKNGVLPNVHDFWFLKPYKLQVLDC